MSSNQILEVGGKKGAGIWMNQDKTKVKDKQKDFELRVASKGARQVRISVRAHVRGWEPNVQTYGQT